MKILMVSAALLGMLSSCWAQTYISGTVGLSRLGADCAVNNSCSNRLGGYGIRGGSTLSSPLGLDFIGGGVVDAIEIGLTKFGRIDASGSLSERYYPGTGGSTRIRVVPTKNSISANSLHASAVARFNLMDQLDVVGRLGVAYVSATSDFYINNTSTQTISESRFAPLLGLGVEYEVSGGVRILSDLEINRFKVAGTSGRIVSINIGAKYGF
jgi:opacity protein-like surface antigen